MSTLLKSWDYSQPDFYHFSQDSIYLAEFAFKQLSRSRLGDLAICEPFAGCGVITIELLGRLNVSNARVTFLEIQKEFLSHIETNTTRYLEKEQLSLIEILCTNYKYWDGECNILIANPPYFIEEHSRPVTDSRRQVCRQMPEREFIEFFQFCYDRLINGGVVFISMKSEIEGRLPDGLQVRGKEISSGTFFYFLEKTDCI